MFLMRLDRLWWWRLRFVKDYRWQGLIMWCCACTSITNTQNFHNPVLTVRGLLCSDLKNKLNFFAKKKSFNCVENGLIIHRLYRRELAQMNFQIRWMTKTSFFFRWIENQIAYLFNSMTYKTWFFLKLQVWSGWKSEIDDQPLGKGVQHFSKQLILSGKIFEKFFFALLCIALSCERQKETWKIRF